MTSIPRKFNREQELERDKLNYASMPKSFGGTVKFDPVSPNTTKHANAKYTKFDLQEEESSLVEMKKSLERMALSDLAKMATASYAEMESRFDFGLLVRMDISLNLRIWIATPGGSRNSASTWSGYMLRSAIRAKDRRSQTSMRH